MKVFNSGKSKVAFFGALASLALPLCPGHPSSQVIAADVSSASTTTVTKGASEDNRLIRDQADRFAKAFSTAQAAQIADMCTDDCTLTDTDGIKYSGRDAIRKMYERTFQEIGGNPCAVHIDAINFPSPDVCIEDGTFFVAKVNNETRYSVVHLKRNGVWQMYRISESVYSPEPADVLKELSWMLGKWTIKDQGQTVSLYVHPIAHGNFLAMRFSRHPEGSTDCDELQLIGWSFKTKDIVSWHYSDDGGFGFGHWSSNGASWINDTKGVRRDGGATLARYKIDRIDNDHFRWQATMRESGGEKLPDLPVVELTRDK